MKCGPYLTTRWSLQNKYVVLQFSYTMSMRKEATYEISKENSVHWHNKVILRKKRKNTMKLY